MFTLVVLALVAILPNALGRAAIDDADPLLNFSTFVGGADSDRVVDVDVDSDGNIYAVGFTRSTDLDTTPGSLQPSANGGECDFDEPCWDGFVTKYSSDGVLLYSTYLGGTRDDFSRAVTVDGDGNAYVAGATMSNDFPTTEGSFQPVWKGGSPLGDAFVTKLSPTGDLVFSTYIGGQSGFGDTAQDLAVNGSGDVYIVGHTDSANFPTTSGAFIESCPPNSGDAFRCSASYAFVLKLDSSGDSLDYSTLVGGPESWTEGSGLAIDALGHAYITGDTQADDFPTTPGAFDETPHGFFSDAFATKLDPTGSHLVYSTVLSGGFWDEGRAIDIDANGNAYITGMTRSHDYPTTTQSFDPVCDLRGDLQCRQYSDGFITKLNRAGSSLAYSSFLEGDVINGYDEAWDVEVDLAGKAFVIGGTTSHDFPTVRAIQEKNRGWACGRAACYDVFITSVSPGGRTVNLSTFYGARLLDYGFGIALSGNKIIAGGGTHSPAFPTKNAEQSGFGTSDDCEELGNAFNSFYPCSDGYVLKLTDPYQTQTHQRGVTLRLRDHLVAFGKLSVRDGFSACRGNSIVNVRRSLPTGKTKLIASTRTDSDGSYKVRLPRIEGSYVARVPERVRELNGRIHVCQNDWSVYRAHFHS